MPHPALEALTTTLRLGAALSSGLNALYFLSYRGVTPRRRIGALVLALVVRAGSYLPRTARGRAPAPV
ncbi:MAG: hypothetical protein EXR55_01795 [Dehalococcoidia bacterium]|nr:hypothetical protein [Dehalococcoidia bacterium]